MRGGKCDDADEEFEAGSILIDAMGTMLAVVTVLLVIKEEEFIILILRLVSFLEEVIAV